MKSEECSTQGIIAIFKTIANKKHYF